MTAMDSNPQNPRLNRLQALLAALLAAITAYFAIRLKGLWGGELLYDPEGMHGGAIPYFRWVIFSAWLGALALAAALWFSAGPPTATQLARRLRLATAAVMLLAVLTAVTQLVMIKHWKGQMPAREHQAESHADQRRP